MPPTLRSQVGSLARKLGLKPEVPVPAALASAPTEVPAAAAETASAPSSPAVEVSPSKFVGNLITGRSRRAWLCADSVYVTANSVLIYGWEWGMELSFNIEGMEGEFVRFARPDVNGSIKLEADAPSGFLTRIVLPEVSKLSDITVSVFDAGAPGKVTQMKLSTKQADPAMSGHLAWVNGQGTVYPHEWTDSPDFLALFAKTLPNWSKPRAHIDRAFHVPGVGYIVEGWALTGFSGAIRAVAASGKWTDIETSCRTPRPDVFDAFKRDLGGHAANTGYSAFIDTIDCKDRLVYLLMEDTEGRWYRLVERGSDDAPFYTVSFIETIFGSTPEAELLLRRLNSGEWRAVEAVHQRWKASFDPEAKSVKVFGKLPAEPQLSVIVPLYGTLDFWELQIARFAKDPDFRSQVELVYVLDDPTLNLAAERTAWRLSELYGVGFTVVWGHHNRGFSGANNLGAAVARADHLFLLNSDAFPVSPGWATSLLKRYQGGTNLGLLGCRLVLGNGALQHDGMAYWLEPQLGLHLCRHPGAGFPLKAADRGLVEVPAATGAAMLISREIFEEIEGFDEGYIVGDFEDSDLCLKVRQAGYTVAVDRTITLTHLERQSMTAIGQPGTRQAVVYINALRHERRWAPLLATLTEDAE